MPFSKIAHESALAKVAAADAIEVPDAIRLGFLHGCRTMKLGAAESEHLGRLAAIALEIAKPTHGLAKIAAEIAPGAQTPAPAGADVDQASVNPSNDPGTQIYKLQLEAAGLGITPEQLAQQRRIDYAALVRADAAATAATKTPAARDMDAAAKAQKTKLTVPGAQPAAPAAKPPAPAPPVKSAVPAVPPPTSAAPKPAPSASMASATKPATPAAPKPA